MAPRILEKGLETLLDSLALPELSLLYQFLETVPELVIVTLLLTMALGRSSSLVDPALERIY